MSLLFSIFVLVTLPIIILIAIGWVVQHHLPEARKVLAFVYANVVLPAFMIHFISTSTLPLTAMWPVVGFTFLQGVMICAVAWLVARSLKLGPSAEPVVTLASAFGNTGNFGIPLVILAFPSEFTVHQSIIAATTAIIFVPLCALLLSPGADSRTWRAAMISVLMNPIVLGVSGGILLRLSGLALPPMIAKPLGMLAAAYTTIALLGLGAALYGGKMQLALPALRISLVLKLLVSPVLTWLLAWALGFSGTILAVFVVAASMPTAALVAVLAAQNDRMRETAASAVFVSTMLAPLIVTVWIYVMRLINP